LGVDYFREFNTGLLTLEPMPEPLKSMLGEGITRETTVNNNNTAYNKNNYNNKDRTILILTRYTCSPQVIIWQRSLLTN
jgi:hypothetical protein